MTPNEFIEDAFNTEHEYLMDALGDLSSDEMAWRAFKRPTSSSSVASIVGGMNGGAVTFGETLQTTRPAQLKRMRNRLYILTIVLFLKIFWTAVVLLNDDHALAYHNEKVPSLSILG